MIQFFAGVVAGAVASFLGVIAAAFIMDWRNGL